MVNRKSWAILTAVAAVAFSSAARAETASDALTLSKPVSAQTSTDKPLMQALDQVGAAKTLKDNRLDVGGYISNSVTYYPDPTNAKGQPGRLFDFENQDPTLNQLGLYIERAVDLSKGEFDIGGRIEWIYGADARFIHSTGTFDYYGNSPNNQFDPVQVYLDTVLPIGTGLKVRTGKFVTGAGWETINPNSPLYSRGLLFTYLLPFTHTGVTGTYNISENWQFELGVIRGWDDSLEDKNANGVSVYSRSSYALSDKKSNIFVTMINGPEYADSNGDYRHLLDVVYTVAYSDQWTFTVQADLMMEDDVNPTPANDDRGWAGGIGGWAAYKYSEYLTFNGRAEYLYDGQGFRFNAPVYGDFDGDGTIGQDEIADGTGKGNNVYSVAFGVWITPFPTSEIQSGLKLRPELRYDYAENSVFGGDNNQLTFAFSALFNF